MGRYKGKKTKVYIAGKVSGLPYDEVLANFARHGVYARKIFGPRVEIVLPTVLCEPGWSWGKCMRVCLKALCRCDVFI